MQLSFREKFDRPIFILSSPRSGSTLLFETLRQAPDLFTIGGESHRLIENIPELSVPAHAWSSNRLTAEDASPEVVETLARAFYHSLHDRGRRPPAGRISMLEKTPKNALRLPFFNAAWPECRLLFLYRDARSTLASMIEAWSSGFFRTYPDLPGWWGQPWSLLLVPGWRDLIGMPLPEVVALQWRITLEVLLDDLATLPTERICGCDYEEFVSKPGPTAERLAAQLGLGWDRRLEAGLPLSSTTVSRPSPDKWRRMESTIEAVWPIVAEVDARAKAVVQRLTS